MAEWTKATVLKTVVLRTPVNESLDLKEAPSNEGAFLFQRHPHREGTGGGVLVTVGVCPSGPMAVLILDHKNSYLAVKNFSDSLGAGWRESEYADR